MKTLQKPEVPRKPVIQRAELFHPLSEFVGQEIAKIKRRQNYPISQRLYVADVKKSQAILTDLKRIFPSKRLKGNGMI